MKGVPVLPRRVFGVAVDTTEAGGRNTWVCRATPGSDGLRIEAVDPLSELPGGATPPAAALRSLAGKILEAPRSAWGFDVPFGLARSELPVLAPASHEGAPWRAAWLDALDRVIAGEQVPQSLRRTERDLRLEAAATERLRVSVSGLVRPLAAKSGVLLLPFETLPVLPEGTPPAMAARAPSTYLLEVAATAVVRRLGEQPGQETDICEALRNESAGRVTLLRNLAAAHWIRPLPRALRLRIADAVSPGAIDAVLLAVGAWRGYRETDHAALRLDPHYGYEGSVYC